MRRTRRPRHVVALLLIGPSRRNSRENIGGGNAPRSEWRAPKAGESRRVGLGMGAVSLPKPTVGSGGVSCAPLAGSGSARNVFWPQNAHFRTYMPKL